MCDRSKASWHLHLWRPTDRVWEGEGVVGEKGTRFLCMGVDVKRVPERTVLKYVSMNICTFAQAALRNFRLRVFLTLLAVQHTNVTEEEI